jgi:serine/threonine protein kinase/Tfp pilus assembly protein PilF
MDIIPEADSNASSTDEAVPVPAEDQHLTLAEQLASQMAESWRRGERLLADELLLRHPQLLESREAAFRLICEEICLAEEAGVTLDMDKLTGRFPMWGTEIQRLLECHELLKLERVPPAPADDILADFQTVLELGSGAQGRVVLARQISLSDRPVVLKITPCKGQEHLSLASLQHTHISPLYWVHEDMEKNQRVLCMPFFGTVTLHAVLHALAAKPPSERSGQDLLDVLDHAQSRLPISLPSQGPLRRFLGSESYVRAVCWIGSRLADALQYAHERNLAHLDLKPSNVLLGHDGQPLLLDFHLARAPIRPDGPRPAGIGGTPQYMSPEQRTLLNSLCDGKPLILPVDGRSDIFSLGLILYQLLGRSLPWSRSLPRLEQCNPAVSPGLADILHKCLAEHPSARYQDARALAADLSRHLEHRPLHGVRNRSWTERWRKLQHRRPGIIPIAVVMGVLAFAVALTGFLFHAARQRQARDRLETIEVSLREGTKDLAERRFQPAIDRLTSGLKLAEETEDAAALIPEFHAQLQLARRARTATTLHRLADQVRFLGGDRGDAAATERLTKSCRELWAVRGDILPAFADAGDGDLEQVRSDLLDVAIIWAGLSVRQATGSQVPLARREALAILAEAESTFGPSPVLVRERSEQQRALGQKKEAKEARALSEQPPRTAWERCALGRSYLVAGDLKRAAALLDQAVAQAPQDFWANFYQGICAYRRSEHLQAISAFRAAITLQPKSAVAFFNRGRAYSKLGDVANALADYNRALQLDPDLGAAALNRGILYLQQKRYEHALQDMKYALSKNGDPALTHFNLALVYQAQGGRAAALASVRRALASKPEYGKARELEKSLSAAP